MKMERGRPLDRLAASGQLVQALAFELQRRVHRRDLLLIAEELRQHRIDASRRQRRHRRSLGDFGFSVARRRELAELHQHAVRLSGVQQPAADLGRLSETYRQQARTRADRDCPHGRL